MNTSTEQASHEAKGSSHSNEHELWDTSQVELTPHLAARLCLQASLNLTCAQKELHDAIFALDGSDASLDRFASARSELDSAEAWALRIAKTVPRQGS
jgi:hypothetical protein